MIKSLRNAPLIIVGFLALLFLYNKASTQKVNQKTCFIILLSTLYSCLSLAANSADWTISEVQMPGTASAFATGINNSGQVIGWIESGTHGSGFLYSGGHVNSLGTLGGSFSRPAGINNFGDVVGLSYIENDQAVHAFLYQNGKMKDIGTLGGNYSSASAINNLGQVVGESSLATGEVHAFFYDGNVMTDITLLGAGHSSAVSINDVGDIVGMANGAFLYSGGTITNLGANFVAKDINNAGQVIGFLDTPIGLQPALYSNGALQALGTLPGYDSLAPDAINDKGQVVGHSPAFLYDKGSFIDLSGLPAVQRNGWTNLGYGTDINAYGQIVGIGQHNGHEAVYVLTPVPEPETYVAMLIGLGILSIRLRSYWAR